MRKSFTELTLLYPKSAYQHAFIYVRQFAIHVRNAMIAKRKVFYNVNLMELILRILSKLFTIGSLFMDFDFGCGWFVKVLKKLSQSWNGLKNLVIP